jgi:hypothetical protein
MALEHMVWLTPKTGVGEDKMEEILASIRALTHIPGVLSISAGQNITDRANGATHGVLVTWSGLTIYRRTSIIPITRLSGWYCASTARCSHWTTNASAR